MLDEFKKQLNERTQKQADNDKLAHGYLVKLMKNNWEKYLRVMPGENIPDDFVQAHVYNNLLRAIDDMYEYVLTGPTTDVSFTMEDDYSVTLTKLGWMEAVFKSEEGKKNYENGGSASFYLHATEEGRTIVQRYRNLKNLPYDEDPRYDIPILRVAKKQESELEKSLKA